MPYRAYSRSQDWLLPPSLDGLLPGDHAARFVAALVDELDLQELRIRAVPAAIGAPAYNPHLLLSCWLYGFMSRVRSSRKLEQACRENIPFMWLTGMQQPDHVTLWRFYKKNRRGMKELFKYTVRLSVEVGLVSFALQAIDGSKVPVASADALKDAQAIGELLRGVEAEIAALEQENRGEGQRGSEQRLRVSKGELKERIVQAMRQLKPGAGEGQEGMTEVPAGSRARRDLACVTDPEARLMKGSHGYGTCYNAQAMVDSAHQVIVAAGVINEQSDSHAFVPLLEQAQDNTGRAAEATLADSGYFSGENLQYAAAHTNLLMPDPQLKRRAGHPEKWPFHKSHFRYDPTHDVYLCPEGKPLVYSHTTVGRRNDPLRVYRCHQCANCPVRNDCTSDACGRAIKMTGHEPLVLAHREKMRTVQARELIGRRKCIIEPVFGIIKEQMDTRRFLLRGLANVRAEWNLLCAAFNMRKLYQHWRRQRLMAAGTGS